MFFQFTGLSLLIHLIIIISATLVNLVWGRKNTSAFQTYNKNGGLVTSPYVNKIISYGILLLVLFYMVALASVAIVTASKMGRDEPQVLFVKAIVGELSQLVYQLVHSESLPVVVLLVVGLWLGYRGKKWLIINLGRMNRSTKFLLSYARLVVMRVSARYLFPLVITRLNITSMNIQKFISRVVPPSPLIHHTRFGVSILFQLVLGLFAGVALLSLPLWARAQIVEPGFESEVVASGLSLATTVAFLPDGRILVGEKSGTIKIIKNGVLLVNPLVTLTDINTFGDRGLLGLAVDPDFIHNGFIYVSYTYENSPGLNIAGAKTGRIVRLTVVGDTADESSKLVLVGSVGGSAPFPSCEDFAVTLDCIPSDSNSHSVGGLRFGPDGKLYASLGDGADFVTEDPRALRAQNLDALSGKMLRLNTDGTAPPDNPFYTGDPNANRSKVFALGLRNMFRFNFNPNNGLLYGGDVGWSTWEEINQITAGGNYGWPCREGNATTSYACTPSSNIIAPIYTYPHSSSGAGSITGGAFFSNSAYPANYATSFFIGDYAQMWIKRVVLDSTGTVSTVVDFIPANVWPVEILAGTDGNIYYLDIVLGTLNRLTHTSGNRRPVVALAATPTAGLAPLTVTFSSVGTFDPDNDALTYTWDFGDLATSSLANPSHTYTQNGTVDAVLTVTDSYGAQVASSIKVVVGNQVPMATIISPASGSLYTPLQQITVTGQGIDPELGSLPDSAFSWDIVLHHNIHTHTVQQFTGSSSITFTADDHNASDVYLEIILTVVDSSGLRDSQSITLYLNNGVGSGNLVSNQSLETPGTLPGSALNWYQGWYGALNPIFTYPTAGLAGVSAASVEITSYTNGNAKWFFTPAYVTPGQSYQFSNLYTATVPTNLTAQFGRPDGTYQYQLLTTLPAVATGTRTAATFVVPPGIETVTVFHEIDQVGLLTVDDYALILAPAGVDVTSPMGSVTSPTASSVLSGVVLVDITATDNVAIGSVELLIDGNLVSVSDSEFPYSIAWDTTQAVDGVHTLSARVKDTAGNEVESAVVAVTVFNGTITTPVNLIINGDFETASGSNPLGWSKGGWGTHTRVHTYPVTGFGGGTAAEVAITSYTFSDTGDAKWQFADVPVTPGTQYTYSTKYQATSISDIIGRYTMADNSVHYFGLIKEIPATSTWATLQNTFVPPANATKVTFFHLISSVATLRIDDVALFVSGTGTPSETNPPLITFVTPTASSTLAGRVTLLASSSDDTAVSGVYFAINGAPFGAEVTSAPYQILWDTTTVPDGVYVLKATAHDPYGNNDKTQISVTVNNTTPPPPPATTTNLVLNPGLEISGTAGNPANWNRGGWGTNNRLFTYPVSGISGQAAQVEITSYQSGDAKWYFDPVSVLPGGQYTVGDKYISTAPTEVLARYTMSGGVFSYQFLGQLPASTGMWQTFSKTVTAPTGATALTLFHVLIGPGQLLVDDASVLGSTTTPTPDRTAPTVSISRPVASTTATGTISIEAMASDSSGIAGVTLSIDGVLVGSQDITAPYIFAWDTSSVANGSHMISARAVDGAGNSANAPVVSVFVNNTTPPPPPATTTNLVLNPGLEISGTAGNPANWNRGGWGTNNRLFTYPVSGISGQAAQVEITSYQSGDAKWYFDPVSVLPGGQYTFTYAYKASVVSNISLRYTMLDGSFVYVGVANPAAMSNWTTGTLTFVPPPGAQAVTVMHILNRVGVLAIDSYTLGSGNTQTFNRGTVSFSFDDGWLEHATIAKPILDAAGIDGTFYIISDEVLGAVPTERITNGDLEIAGTAGNPANWNRGGWGTNTATYTYPVAGYSGSAAEVSISSYQNGDVKWFSDPVLVQIDTEYTLSEAYRSTAATEILVRYTHAGGNFTYQYLTSRPSTNNVWQTYTQTFTTPADATELTIFHVLPAVGTLAVDDLSVKPLQIYADVTQIESLEQNGHEIGAHTKTHPSLTTLNTAAKTTEIVGSRQALLTAGFNPVLTLAYPYGSYDDEVQTITAIAGFTSARSVDRGYNDLTTDRYALKIQQVGRTTTPAQITSWIDQAILDKTWLILMFHQISDDVSATLGITQADFQSVVNYTATAAVDTVTISEGVALLP